MPNAAFFAGLSYAGSLADPSGSGAIAAAMAWLQGTLLGTLATTVAVIAVAWVGLMMLSGRVNLRHGLTVIAGCFILFGASVIAAGIRALAEAGPVAYAPPPSTPPPAPQSAPPPQPVDADPYAGAAVPGR